MGYLLPTTAAVSATWQEHRDREPPSAEPGTDYACAYGTPLLAPAPGVVSAASNSTSGGTGRYCTIQLDDGRAVRFLHLSAIHVQPGDRVERGVIFADSGASGFGLDWGYGAHVHVTLWEQPGLSVADSIDFATYADAPDEATERMEDDMPAFFEPNVIVWPNGWANSYDDQVWAGMRGYVNDPNNPGNQWIRDTYVRESWAAVDGIQQRQAEAVQVSQAGTGGAETRWALALTAGILLGVAADAGLITIAAALFHLASA
jgi:murein DD-endopeptidase MepM/ murein hydrolase activator NlpD